MKPGEIAPQPPSWNFDWPGLTKQFAFLDDLYGCPQDAGFHAEGDVGIHTEMACQALTKLEGWQSLPADERAAVFIAVLLSRRIRDGLVELFVGYGARCKIVYVEVDETTLHQQNQQREKAVPRHVLTKLVDSWTVPTVMEAHEVIYVVDGKQLWQS